MRYTKRTCIECNTIISFYANEVIRCGKHARLKREARQARSEELKE